MVKRKPGTHACEFNATGHLQGRARTYERFKAAALAAGRLSSFDINSKRDAVWFNDLRRECNVVPDGYPWYKVTEKKPRENPDSCD